MVQGKSRSRSSNNSRSLDLPWKLLVGTHHKTGTKWFGSIFRSIQKKFSLMLFSGKQDDLPDNWDIFLQDHSRFGPVRSDNEYRGVHVIRDPRDVIVSGCFYHMKSDEAWLHIPREELDGRSYQEAINGLSTNEEKLLFEMENAASWVMDDLMKWDYEDPDFIEVKYEDLMQDTHMFLFHRVFVHLGFPAWTIPEVLDSVYRNSLFSGMVLNTDHIRSGDTKQWKKHFSSANCRRFLELYDDILVKLGYEQDNSWAVDH